jgi:cytochrome b561
MEQALIIKRKIYDPLQRTLHWCIALCVLMLLITGFSSNLFEPGEARNQLWHFHIKTGYVLITAVLLRFIWSLIGPKFAHFRDLLKFFNQNKKVKNHRFTQFGHDDKAALAYLCLYSSLIVMIVTGLVLGGIEHNTGPFASSTFDRLYLLSYFKGPHELLSFIIIIFTFSHLGALFWHQYQLKLPMWYSMFDGIQYRFKKNKRS